MIVLTNGVFDLLHIGHLRSLEWARQQGDSLVVAINSDESTRRLKPGRPFLNASLRAEQLLALRCVDQVLVFDEDDAVSVVNKVRPDVYVKGDEYRGVTTPEYSAVTAYGGVVRYAPTSPGFSTSDLVRYIRGAASSFPRS